MNFYFFESLSPQDAHEHLQGFLHNEKHAVDAMAPLAKNSDLRLDYSIVSLPGVLKWLLRSCAIRRVAVPASEPEWVRDFHKGGLVEFSDESKYLVLRAAYYLGECFVRSSQSLYWTVGNPALIEKNMPVVAGFRDGDEMAPIMICENVFGSILGDGKPESVIETMIDTWTGFMPG